MVRRIAHISDLHFGTIVDENIDEALRDSIRSNGADMIILSGDLTQRARKEEFKKAKDFCRSFSIPIFVTPGNHDIEPWWFPFRRLLDPYKTYGLHFGRPAQDIIKIGNCVLVFILTSRPLSIQKGVLFETQADAIIERLNDLDYSQLFIVTHHPLTFEDTGNRKFCTIPYRLIDWLSKQPSVVLFSGHTHIQQTDILRHCGRNVCLRSIAGTALSRRWRGGLESTNQYTFVESLPHGFAVESYSYSRELSQFYQDGREFYNLGRNKE